MVEATTEQEGQVISLLTQEERIADLEYRLGVVIDILAGLQRGFGNVKFTNPEEEE